MGEYKVYDDAEEVAQALAIFIADAIDQVVSEKNECHVVVPGGTTPARCLQILAKLNLPWGKIWWYPSDERCYPIGHKERNDVMIKEHLMKHQKDFQDHIISIPAEMGSNEGAKAYKKKLQNIKTMDIVLLGMGEDGHTASLFPHNLALENDDLIVAVHDALKAPAERISFGLNTLQQAPKKIVVATGEAKKIIFNKIQKGKSFPVTQVEPDFWFVDKVAFV